MAGVIAAWNKTKPAGTDYIDVSDEFLRDNWTALEVMVGSPTINLVVLRASAATVDVDADRIALFNTASPPLCLVARSVNLTANIGNIGVANGLDAGAEAGSTWYFIWVIYNPTTDTVASLLSISATAPTMPAGYTFKRLVGAVRNDASSNFVAFAQRGNRVAYKAGLTDTTLRILNAGAAVAWTQIALAAWLPSIAKRTFGLVKLENTTNNEWTILDLADDASGNYQIASFAGTTNTTRAEYTRGYWEQELVADIDLYYKLTAAVGTPKATLYLTGFYIEI